MFMIVHVFTTMSLGLKKGVLTRVVSFMFFPYSGLFLGNLYLPLTRYLWIAFGLQEKEGTRRFDGSSFDLADTICGENFDWGRSTANLSQAASIDLRCIP